MSQELNERLVTYLRKHKTSPPIEQIAEDLRWTRRLVLERCRYLSRKNLISWSEWSLGDIPEIRRECIESSLFSIMGILEGNKSGIPSEYIEDWEGLISQVKHLNGKLNE